MKLCLECRLHSSMIPPYPSNWGTYLPWSDSAQDIDDAVGLLLSLLGILLAKQSTATQEMGQPHVTTYSICNPCTLCFLLILLEKPFPIFPVFFNSFVIVFRPTQSQCVGFEFNMYIRLLVFNSNLWIIIPSLCPHFTKGSHLNDKNNQLLYFWHQAYR